MPQVRHGFGTEEPRSRCAGGQFRTARHDAAVLDWGCVGVAGVHRRHGAFGSRMGSCGMGERQCLSVGQFILSTPVVLWTGWPFFVRGWRSLVNRRFNMFTLIALGVGAAYAFSVVALLFPHLFPPEAGHGGKPALYFEAAAVIIVLVLLGQVLELRARQRTGGAIKALLASLPRPLVASPRRATRTCRLMRCIPATSCVCGPGKSSRGRGSRRRADLH